MRDSEGSSGTAGAATESDEKPPLFRAVNFVRGPFTFEGAPFPPPNVLAMQGHWQQQHRQHQLIIPRKPEPVGTEIMYTAAELAAIAAECVRDSVDDASGPADDKTTKRTKGGAK